MVTTVKGQKQLKYLLVNEWLIPILYSTMGDYLALRRNYYIHALFYIHASKQVSLKIMLSDKSQTKRIHTV